MFFELTSDDFIEPDTAVKQLEVIVADLCDLDSETLEKFKQYVESEIQGIKKSPIVDSDKEKMIEVCNCTLESIDFNRTIK